MNPKLNILNPFQAAYSQPIKPVPRVQAQESGALGAQLAQKSGYNTEMPSFKGANENHQRGLSALPVALLAEDELIKGALGGRLHEIA